MPVTRPDCNSSCESAQTLAQIRHLRVIRINTAFTLHSAHSSCAAVAQRKCTVFKSVQKSNTLGQIVLLQELRERLETNFYTECVSYCEAADLLPLKSVA